MSPVSAKLTFSLSKEQSGPFPVSTESLWCDVEGDYFRVKNIPFFIDGISYDDLIAVCEVSEGLFEISSVIEHSNNSTIWLYLEVETVGKKAIEALRTYGCGVESGVLDNYYAVNVPASVNLAGVTAIIQAGVMSGAILCDYPSIRHA